MAGAAKKVSKNGMRVGIREFRQNIAKYVLESEAPITLTRHGSEIGYFIPLPKHRWTEADRKAFREAGDRVQKMLADAGLDGDQIVEQYERERKARRRRELGLTE